MIEFGAVVRPYPGEPVSGDCWLADERHGVYRVTVIDGLGHGPDAALAARTARDALVARPELGPAMALEASHDALRGLRGAAISIARIDLQGGLLAYTGIGNVEARLLQDGREQRLVPVRGIVGHVFRLVRVTEVALAPTWLLVMHTDGVTGRFELRDLVEPDAPDPATLARTLLERWGRDTDDACVVVARPTSSR